MPTTLATFRQLSQPSPAKFVATSPGSWIQYYDDTPAKGPKKALSARRFQPLVAERKQQEQCAVCFSLQAFGASRTKEGLLCFHNLGVDVDLLSPAERSTLTTAALDHRKEEYLLCRLLAFPLRPHWLIETRHGFHVIFRIQPVMSAEEVPGALAVNRRLVQALQGDLHAVLLTQVLRVPGTLQFKNPEQPFLCLLLLDNAATIVPYYLSAVRSTLDAWEERHPSNLPAEQKPAAGGDGQVAQWRDGLQGVPEGQRNAAAAAIAGGILGRLPDYLWEVAGWGGLKEWNRRNPVPLPERELRSVFNSIARREQASRQRAQPRGSRNGSSASSTAASSPDGRHDEP